MSTAAILVVAAFVCAVLAAFAFAVAIAALGLDPTMTWLEQHGTSTSTAQQITVPAGLAIYAALSATVVAAAHVRGGADWRDLVGWHPWHPFRRRAWPFWVLLAATLAYSVGADQLVTQLDPAAKEWTPRPNGLLWDVLFLGLAAVLAPLTEELLFRGWIYTALRGAIGVVAAIVVSAALFALAHWEDTHLYAAAIFPVGLALGVVRERTDSIAASITFHALYNAVASILLFTQT